MTSVLTPAVAALYDVIPNHLTAVAPDFEEAFTAALVHRLGTDRGLKVAPFTPATPKVEPWFAVHTRPLVNRGIELAKLRPDAGEQVLRVWDQVLKFYRA
jgi:hypothetical protein